MADTRKFDYEAVKSIYLDMNKIIGDNNEGDSLSGIITKIDKDYHDYVGMVDEACYGALGDQLLLDWDNTSSDFPKFIENFRNWSALVAQAAGNYSAFEQQVTGMQDADKFGFAGSGLTNNYVNSSAYHDYAANNGEAFEFLNANMNDIYQLTGCTYLQSGASERLKTQKVLNTILCGGDVLAIAVLATGAYSVLNPATAGSTELVVADGGSGVVATETATAGTTGATGATGATYTAGTTPLLEGGATATGATGAAGAVDIAEGMNAIRTAAQAGQFASKKEAMKAVAKLFGYESAGMIPDGSAAHAFLVEILGLL